MNMTLLKDNVRTTWKPFVVFAAVLTMYFTIVSTMYDPEFSDALNQFAEVMPQVMAMVGMGSIPTTLVGFMANYLYGFLMLVFPMVFAIMTANRLVARHVDRGSMAYLLAAPVTRGRVALTQAVTLILSLLLLVVYCTALGIICCEIQFPGELDLGRFLILNLGAFCVQLFISGICFLASCLSNDTKWSLGFGAGLPTVFYLTQMLANMGGKLENLKYATPFTLFDTNGIAMGEQGAAIGMTVLAAVGLLLYLAAIQSFKKRDLPL